jgi:hypothetical protein
MFECVSDTLKHLAASTSGYMEPGYYPYIYGVKYLLPCFLPVFSSGKIRFPFPEGFLYASFPRKFQDKNGRFFHYFPYQTVLCHRRSENVIKVAV